MKTDMGRIVQRTTVINSGQQFAADNSLLDREKVKSIEVDFLVDTGASMICLPSSLIAVLELRQVKQKQAMTANGVVNRWTYSPVTIKIFDREADLNVMELPEGTTPLLGYLALEALDLYPNPHKQILEGNPATGGKMIVDLM